MSSEFAETGAARVCWHGQLCDGLTSDCWPGHPAETDALIADLRERLADGLCLCSSAHTDWRGVEALLDRLERAEAMHAEAFRIAVENQERVKQVEDYASQCAILRVEPSTAGLRHALSSPPRGGRP